MPIVEIVVNQRAFSAAGDAQRRKLREYAHRLRDELYFGVRIPRHLVPKRFRHLPNLFRLELPGGWRAPYAVIGKPALRVRILIVWIGDHTRYNRLLGYS